MPINGLSLLPRFAVSARVRQVGHTPRANPLCNGPERFRSLTCLAQASGGRPEVASAGGTTIACDRGIVRGAWRFALRFRAVKRVSVAVASRSWSRQLDVTCAVEGRASPLYATDRRR